MLLARGALQIYGIDFAVGRYAVAVLRGCTASYFRERHFCYYISVVADDFYFAKT